MKRRRPALDWMQLADRCRSLGWSIRACTANHWQITGALATAVNIYFRDDGKMTIHVGGTAAGITTKPTIGKIIQVCNDARTFCERKCKRKDVRNHKLSMLDKHPFCNWCNHPLDKQTATVDHKIPLSKGGSNHRNNLCLSCLDCNRKRADSAKPILVEGE